MAWSKHLYLLAYAGCLLTFLFATGILLLQPAIFPAGGFTGPAHWRQETPLGIRFSGDSYRYLEGAERVLAGEALSSEQAPYRGYIWVVAACLRSGSGLRGLVAMQVLAAALALWTLMAVAKQAGGAGLAAVAGGIYALNPDLPVWHTFVMTESLYISAVCLTLWLLCHAAPPRRCWRQGLAMAAIIMFAMLRQTGWVLLPTAMIFWITKTKWRRHWQFVGVLAVILLFLTLAFGMAGFREGISGQSPVDKLYSGEVVWQEDLWRVSMPPAGADNSYLGAVGYICRHPAACVLLAARRLAVLFLRVRPGYSVAHNAILLAVYLPLAVFGALGAWWGRKRPEAQAALALVLAHALVVALTFNDNDGRFSLYLTPPLGMLAAVALVRIAGWVAGQQKIVKFSVAHQ